MSTHEGVSCDVCQKSNFKGKRFKCLQCFDYDLCAECYEQKATTGRHQDTHPMQCLLTLNDISIFYAGEAVRKQSWSYTCPICGLKGLSEESMTSHVNEKHTNDFTEVICPICASVPGVEPNQMVEFFVNHMNSNIHQNCDDNSGVRIRQRIRGTSSNRHRRSQFAGSSSAGSGAGNPIAGGSSGAGSVGGASLSSRDTQLGSVAQFLTQFSDSRFIRSYAPGQQTVTSSTSSSRQPGSSNCDRFVIPKWGQMRTIDDAPWEGRKNESFASRALCRKDDTPWLRNPPATLNDEPSEEVSIFEMDRSAFVIQLLLSTLSIDVPLHGTDPEPKRRLFDDESDEQPVESIPKESSPVNTPASSSSGGSGSGSSSTQSSNTPTPPSHSSSVSPPQPMNESIIQNIIPRNPYPPTAPTTATTAPSTTSSAAATAAILTNSRKQTAMKILLHQQSTQHGGKQQRLQSQK